MLDPMVTYPETENPAVRASLGQETAFWESISTRSRERRRCPACKHAWRVGSSRASAALRCGHPLKPKGNRFLGFSDSCCAFSARDPACADSPTVP